MVPRHIEGFDEDRDEQRPLALFPWDREIPGHALDCGVGVRLRDFELRRPRQWGAGWLACELYRQLGLEEFWAQRLPDSREDTCWRHILQTLVCDRLMDPGSEWRLHRPWFEQSAMGDLLGEDFALVEKNALYRVHDQLLKHKPALFDHLSGRWKDLFGAKFEVLLYDLTSAYFEADASPDPQEGDRKRFGYSRDKRPDCEQVVIALMVTPEGFPLAYGSPAWQHQRQDHAARFPPKDRNSVWQGPAHLGDGSRHSHRGSAGRNARERSADLLSGRHAQRPAQKI